MNSNYHFEFNKMLQNLLRVENYLSTNYIIKDTVELDFETFKYFGMTLENNNLNVIITQYNSNLDPTRINQMIKLIEDNVILVENIWIEENQEDKFSLFISEFTKEVYQNEFGICSFNNHMQITRGENIEKNLNLLKNFLHKLEILHNFELPHLNLSTNNLFFNNKTEEVFLGAIRIKINDELSSDWYSSPEITFGVKNLDLLFKNDIWSIGCIICEIFFSATPIFQSFSIRDKIKRLFEILAVPNYSDVKTYISEQEYKIIQNNYISLNPLILELINSNVKGHDSFTKELQNIILNCLNFNPNKRYQLKRIINSFIDLDDLSFNYKYRNKSRENKKNIITDNEENQNENSDKFYKIYKFENKSNLNKSDPKHNEIQELSSRRENPHKYLSNEFFDTNKPKTNKYIFKDNDEYKNLNENLDDLMEYLKKLDLGKY